MRRLVPLFFALVAAIPPASAQTYPDRPIKVIVPYGPGGVDVQMRLAGPFMQQILGQPIVVENRGGGGATIGTAAVKSAEPDGYTLLFTGTSALSVVPHMQKTSYKMDDFVPIGNITATGLVVVARLDAPFKTLAELVAYAKQNPERVNMGSSGTGTTTHMIGEAMQLAAGVKFTHVPYTGLGAIATGMLSGAADLVFAVPGTFLPHVNAGKMRVLASTGARRSEFRTDVPTLKEAGYDVVEETKFGVFAPKGTPQPIVAKLSQALKAAVTSKEFEELMRKNMVTALYLDPPQMMEALRGEETFWTGLLKRPEMRGLVQTQ